MPLRANPYDDVDLAKARALADDPWAMYYVARSDHQLGFGQALTLAGAGAVLCSQRYRLELRWQAAFSAWYRDSYRKIALRANAEQFAAIEHSLDALALSTAAGVSLLCLPPRRKSEREPALIELAPFTDARLPKEEIISAPSDSPVLTYIIRDHELKSMGKAMAQGGHAAMICLEAFPERHAFALWGAGGCRGRLRRADTKTWERIKAETDCVVVVDAGFTQVAAGTETVLALPPAYEEPALVSNLPLVP